MEGSSDQDSYGAGPDYDPAMRGCIGNSGGWKIIDENRRASTQNGVGRTHTDAHTCHGGGGQVHNQHGWHTWRHNWAAHMGNWSSEHGAGVHVGDSGGRKTHK